MAQAINVYAGRVSVGAVNTLTLWLALVLLSGCSAVKFVPHTQQAEKGSEQAGSATSDSAITDSTAMASAEVAAPLALTPNPYFTSKRAVPAAARQLHRQAVNAMTEKQWAEAEKLLQQLTVDYPKLSGPYLNLGLLYRHTERPAEAEQAMVQAIAVNRKNLNAYNQLAILKREQGAFADAERLYLRALAVWPQHADSHRNLGILYDLYMGQFDKALQHFETYQSMQATPDKQLAGWIADLKRRQSGLARAGD